MKYKRPTTKIPEGTKNLSINMPTEEVEDIRALAKASGMSMGEYVRTLIEEARRSEVKYRTLVQRVDDNKPKKITDAIPLIRGRRGYDPTATESGHRNMKKRAA